MHRPIQQKQQRVKLQRAMPRTMWTSQQRRRPRWRSQQGKRRSQRHQVPRKRLMTFLIGLQCQALILCRWRLNCSSDKRRLIEPVGHAAHCLSQSGMQPIDLSKIRCLLISWNNLWFHGIMHHISFMIITHPPQHLPSPPLGLLETCL